MDSPSNAVSGQICVIFGGVSLLRPMSGTGVQCHVASCSAGNLLRYSRKIESFSAIPALDNDPERALASLVDVGAKFPDKPVLYYGNDSTLRFVSKYRDVLSEVFRFLMPAQEIVTACTEKDLFNSVVEELGVPFPQSLVVENTLDDDALRRMPMPCAIKPRLTSDQRAFATIAQLSSTQKAIVADSLEDARRVVEQLLGAGIALVIQALIPGAESNIFSYHAYNDVEIRPLGEFAGQKVRTYPEFGGKSTCLRLVDDKEVLDVGRHIARELRIAGPLKLDFKRSAKTGELILIEANPRFTLWNHLGAACGINLSYMAHQYLTGSTVNAIVAYRTDRHWVTIADDLRSHIAGHSGRLSSIVRYPFFRNKPVFQTFAWDDPLPSVIGLKRQIRIRR